MIDSRNIMTRSKRIDRHQVKLLKDKKLLVCQKCDAIAPTNMVMAFLIENCPETEQTIDITTRRDMMSTWYARQMLNKLRQYRKTTYNDDRSQGANQKQEGQPKDPEQHKGNSKNHNSNHQDNKSSPRRKKPGEKKEQNNQGEGQSTSKTGSSYPPEESTETHPNKQKEKASNKNAGRRDRRDNENPNPNGNGKLIKRRKKHSNQDHSENGESTKNQENNKSEKLCQKAGNSTRTQDHSPQRGENQVTQKDTSTKDLENRQSIKKTKSKTLNQAKKPPDQQGREEANQLQDNKNLEIQASRRRVRKSNQDKDPAGDEKRSHKPKYPHQSCKTASQPKAPNNILQEPAPPDKKTRCAKGTNLGNAGIINSNKELNK